MSTDWQKAEEAVRRYLCDLYGQQFSKRLVQLTQKLELGDGKVVEEFEFDAVSEDGKVIAEVKSVMHPEYPVQMQNAEADVARLALARGEKKLVFLVDPPSIKCSAERMPITYCLGEKAEWKLCHLLSYPIIWRHRRQSRH